MKNFYNAVLEKARQQLGFLDVRAFLVGVMAIAILVAGYGLLTGDRDSQPVIESGDSTAAVAVAATMSSSTPIRLRIPKINLDVPFSDPLGLGADGSVAVPDGYDTVGWYKYGPTPGALGPAVVLGHVDSYSGPAVFFSLGQLEEGSDIFVDREDGSVAHFVVTKMSRHNQNDFPTKEVYGDLPYAGLRLITCTGIYNRENKRYTHNLIVYAKLVERE